MTTASLFLAMTLAANPAPPPPVLTTSQQQELLAKTLNVSLGGDTSKLSDPEKFVVARLIEVGRIFQDLYESSRHKDALAVRRRLEKQKPDGSEFLLYRAFQGPIATTLQNERIAFVPVAPEVPGKNVYPWGITRAELDAFLSASPAARDALLDPWTVVRRADRASLQQDLAALRKHPVLAALHPGLAQRLRELSRKPDAKLLYALPYAVAYANELVRAHDLLREAADRIHSEDRAFADYLRHRARDLLANDYEAGDASWATGDFQRLNAQIGAYETYDDELLGQKAFHSLSILLRDEEATAKLEQALGGLQKLEDSLPYTPHKTVRTRIPVGVYDVLADFGQSRSANTASILPNDEDHARRYGRVILLRANVLKHPELFATEQALFRAAVAPAQRDWLAPEGKFNRTLWHEIGHYLGPDRDVKGRAVTAALEDTYSAMEELKADLISLYAVPQLRQLGFYDDRSAQQVYANALLRTLNPVKPRRAQPYQTMMLMQFNWFLDRGAFTLGAEGLTVDPAKFHDAATAMLTRVLELQQKGDRTAADAFITEWFRWDERHEQLAAKLRAQQRWRFYSMRYPALGD